MMATVDLDMADLFSDPEDMEELIENQGVQEDVREEGEEERMPEETGEERDAAEKEDPGNIDMPTTEPKKKRVVKNPQPKLNPDRLCGPRGMAIIEDIFRDMTFRGKGYEKEDLGKVMKKLEHWAHRLFPKLPFDDCLEKIEKLGTKKQVQTHVKKIRLNMNVLHEQFQKDQLLEEELDEEPRVQEVEEDVFDELLREHASNTAVPPAPVQVTVAANPVGLSEEQHQRMIRNRQLAEERRQAKLQKQQQQSSEDMLCEEQGRGMENERILEQGRGMEDGRTDEQDRGTENERILEQGRGMENERIVEQDRTENGRTIEQDRGTENERILEQDRGMENERILEQDRGAENERILEQGRGMENERLLEQSRGMENERTAEQNRGTENERILEQGRGMENERIVEQDRTENGRTIEQDGISDFQASQNSVTETDEQDRRDTCGQTVQSCVTSEQDEMDTSL